jgi:ribosomal protein S18 acetylase RimI-like enzyme
MPTQQLTIRSMRTAADAVAFRRLNEAWIEQLFTMEAADRATLDDPEQAIIARGGDVLIAHDGDRAVGCVSLVPEGDGVFELSKMTVAESDRGRGIGRALIEAAIARGRALGGRRLVLATNHRLTPAIALYESAGFEHLPPAPSPYARADTFMALSL